MRQKRTSNRNNHLSLTLTKGPRLELRSGSGFSHINNMSLNIIVKSGGRRNISDEETAHYLAKREEARIVEEKHTYKERARKARKAAENMQLP